MKPILKVMTLACLTVLLPFACVGDSVRRVPVSPVADLPTAVPPDAPTPRPPEERAPLASPYRPKAHMYRGQLHAHTTNSDGKQPPARVMAAYRDHGYAFAAITDHNFNTPDPRVSGILFVPGVENDHTCLHENRINARTVAPGERLSQDVIDQARAEGSFVQINHPDWPGSFPKNPCWSDAALLTVHGYDAVEVWNASNDANNSNAEPRIDYLLSHWRRTNLTAVDDCHDVRSGYCMTSSVNVFADALTLDEVMANLKAGNYYSSSGALISSVSTTGRTVTVEVPAPSDIEFITNYGTVAKTERRALSASYEVAISATYVRIRVTGYARQKAWTNPIYVRGSAFPAE